MFDAPVTFQQAADQLSSRMDRPTAMKYQAIVSTWDANARRHAFFSSRVAESGILGELHRRAQAVVEGKMSRDQARRLLREYFVGEGADALAALGFAPPKDARGVTQLASIPRLELILDTNVRMAQETGHWQKWKRMSKAYPYGIWRVGVCDNHRKSHLERDGKVYAFDHPIWTQSPPGGEFHCHCRRELATAEDLEDMGVKPEPNDSSFEPSSLGFDPSADDFPKPPVGKRVPDPIAKKAEQKMKEDAADLAKKQETIEAESIKNPYELGSEEWYQEEKRREKAVKAEARKEAKRQEQIKIEEENKLKKELDNYTPPDLNYSAKVETEEELSEFSQKEHDLQEMVRFVHMHSDSAEAGQKQPIIKSLRVWLDNMKAEWNSRKIAVKNPAHFSTNAPQDLEQKANKAINVFNRIISDTIKTNSNIIKIEKGLIKNGWAREGYDDEKDIIRAFSNSSIPDMCHEMAHWLEKHAPGIHHKCVTFLNMRCRRDGSKPVKLRDLFPNSNYQANEMTRVDSFRNPYVGKQYIDKTTKECYATEILSTGIEWLLKEPEKFMREDYEHYKFVLSCLGI